MLMLYEDNTHSSQEKKDPHSSLEKRGTHNSQQKRDDRSGGVQKTLSTQTCSHTC